MKGYFLQDGILHAPVVEYGVGSAPLPPLPEHYPLLLLPTFLQRHRPTRKRSPSSQHSGSGLGIHASWLPPSPTQGSAGLQHVCVWVKRSTFELWLQERTACTATRVSPATKNVQQRIDSPHLKQFFFKEVQRGLFTGCGRESSWMESSPSPGHQRPSVIPAKGGGLTWLFLRSP